MHHAGRREDALPAANRTDAAEVERNLLRQEEKTGLQHVDRHARQTEQPEDGQQIAGQRPKRGVPLAGDESRVGREPRLAAELAAAVVHEESDQSAAERHQDDHAREQHDRRAEILALGHVPFLPGLLPAVRRGLQGFVGGVVGHGG